MIAFAFLPQNFGRWQGRMNGILSFYEHRLSNEGTHRWIRLNVLHSDTKNLPRDPYAPCATHAPPSHMVKLLLPDIDFYHLLDNFDYFDLLNNDAW